MECEAEWGAQSGARMKRSVMDAPLWAHAWCTLRAWARACSTLRGMCPNASGHSCMPLAGVHAAPLAGAHAQCFLGALSALAGVVHTPCGRAAGMHASRQRAFAGDVHTLGDGMRSVGECLLFDVHFIALRSVFLGGASSCAFGLHMLGQHVLTLILQRIVFFFFSAYNY